MKMDISPTSLKEDFHIRELMSFHYFECAKDYVFKGEKHNFWEFLYVDRGEVEVMADTCGYKLKQGDMIFHKPNEFHSVWANNIIAPNFIVISFSCDSAAMKNFENRIFNLSDSERNLLAAIVKEGFNTFLPPYNLPFVHRLTRRQDAPFGSEQMIFLGLETLLIKLMRLNNPATGESRLSSVAKERSEADIFKRITAYMRANIYENITFSQLCDFSGMGKTNLKNLFKSKASFSPIEYFKRMKIENAKELIREEKLNFTEISEKLGYSSIHSFSRHFKTVTGISPSEYAKTVQARV